jgi:hypothetical protein
MKLSREQVEKISKMILMNLKEKKLLEFKADEARVLEKINEVMLEDLRAEEALDREVEAIIDSHSGDLGGQSIDRRKMFNMIKNRLAKERGLTL